MKTWEIIREAQENGAKIRVARWTHGWYIKWNGLNWVDQSNQPSNSTSLGSNWEIHVEPIKTFGPARAMYWLERGKFLVRQGRGKDRIIKMHLDNVREYHGGFVFSGAWFHNDWHLCDENGNYIPEPEDEKCTN